MLFLALYRVFNSMEPLYFDSLAETDVVKRFPTSAKVFLCPPRAGLEPVLPARQPHALATQPPRLQEGREREREREGALKQLVEKYKEKRKTLCVESINFEKKRVR